MKELSSRSSLPAGVLGLVAEALDMAKVVETSLWGSTGVEELLGTLREAFELFGVEFGISEAQKVNPGFKFEKEMIDADVNLFYKSDCSIVKMAEKLTERDKRVKLNARRVRALKLFDKDPEGAREDWERLEKLADEGVEMSLPEGFVPNKVPGKLRLTYKKVQNAVNTSISKYKARNSCIILPWSDLKRAKENLHFNDIHWVVKQDAVEGRTISDASSSREGSMALNSEDVKQAGIEKYGELVHPSILDYVGMVLLAREHYKLKIRSGKRLMMIKLDFERAFMQFKLHPRSVPYVCFPLTGALVMLWLTGFFGWTSFPQVWGIITRIMLRVLESRGVRFCKGYVDDFSMMCIEEEVLWYIKIFCESAELLLGKGCIADEKTVFGRKIVHIGWCIDLDGGPRMNGDPVGTVSMSRRNLLKLLFGFFSIPLDYRLDRNSIEKLASWMGRYSGVVFPQLRPFSSVLFKEISGLSRNIVKQLSSEVIDAIKIWRSFLCLMVMFPSQFERPLYHLQAVNPSIVLNFDASWFGLGIRFFHVLQGKKRECFKIIHVKFSEELYHFARTKDPSYQNALEFATASLGLFALVLLGFRDISVFLEGDSMTALCWSAYRSFRSGPSFYAACAQMVVALKYNVTIAEEFQHLSVVNSVEANYDADWISRHPLKEVERRYPESILSSQISDPWIDKFLKVINPELVLSKSVALWAQWNDVSRTTEELVLEYGSSGEIPNCSLEESELQIFVMAPEPFPRFTWSGPRSSLVGTLIEFIVEKYSVFELSAESFFAPRYGRFLDKVNKGCRVSDVFVNGDCVTWKVKINGGGIETDVFSEADMDELLEKTRDLLSLSNQPIVAHAGSEMETSQGSSMGLESVSIGEREGDDASKVGVGNSSGEWIPMSWDRVFELAKEMRESSAGPVFSQPPRERVLNGRVFILGEDLKYRDKELVEKANKAKIKNKTARKKRFMSEVERSQWEKEQSTPGDAGDLKLEGGLKCSGSEGSSGKSVSWCNEVLNSSMSCDRASSSYSSQSSSKEVWPVKKSRGRPRKSKKRASPAVSVKKSISGSALGLDASEMVPLGVKITDGDVWALEGDEVGLQSITGVEDSTRACYEKYWHYWPSFLKLRGQLRFLYLDLLDKKGKTCLLSLFVMWLREHWECSDSKLDMVLSAVSYAFILAAQNVEIFSDPLVKKARKTNRASSRETSMKAFFGKSAKLPATNEVLREIKKQANWNSDGECEPRQLAVFLRRRAAYLACMFCFNFGSRFCNVGRDEKHKGKHAIRRCDVVIEDIDGLRYSIPDFVAFLVSKGVWHGRTPEWRRAQLYVRVLALVVFIHSSKIRKKVGRVEVLGRRTSEENEFLGELLEWLFFDSGHLIGSDQNELVFSWKYDSGRRSYHTHLIRSWVSNAVKEAAKALGLDAARYSTHSLKRGAITDLMLNGEDDEVLRTFGDHSPNSSSTFLYQHATGRGSRPLLHASKGKGLTVKEIKRCTLTPVSFDSLARNCVINEFAEIDDDLEFEVKCRDVEEEFSSSSASDSDDNVNELQESGRKRLRDFSINSEAGKISEKSKKVESVAEIVASSLDKMIESDDDLDLSGIEEIDSESDLL